MYILTGKAEHYKQKLLEIDTALNAWLLKEFNTLLHVSFVAIETNQEKLSVRLDNVLKQLSYKIYAGKNQKFFHLIKNAKGNKVDFSFISTTDPSIQQCVICGNDRQEIKMVQSTEQETQYTCSFCANLIRLGNKLPDTHYIYTAGQSCDDSIQIQDTWYILCSSPIQGKECSLIFPNDSPDFFSTIPEQGIIHHGKQYIRKIVSFR